MSSFFGECRIRTGLRLGLQLLAMAAFASATLLASDSNSKRARELIKEFEESFKDGRTRYGTLQERMALHRVPGLSIAVLKNGKLAWAKGYGLISANETLTVNPETVFSVGSVSKLVTAVITMRLVAQGKVNLEEDVNRYLSWWQVPPSPSTQKQPVTLRHIMSHTAGFTIHGFADFQPGETLPNVIHTLTGKPPAKHGPVVVDFKPGSRFRYSGGGTTVQQLVIQQVTQQNFPEAARQIVFDPLAMRRSTFQNPIPATFGNIAKAHDRQGQPTALPRGWESMPEMAASGLWTTPRDLAAVFIMLIRAYSGAEQQFLSKSLVQDMLTPVSPGPFGLGPQIYSEKLFGHGGSNNSYKASAMAHLGTGNGIIVFANGANGSDIIEEVTDAMRRLEKWPK